MSDIIGETDGLGLVLYSGTRDELQAKLRKRDDEITRLRSYVEKLEHRLEIDRVWECGSDGKMVLVEVPKDQRPDEPHDGIFCRDETIKLLHEAITRLRSLLKEAGDALEPIAPRWIDPLSIAREHWQRASTVLSKIKGEA